MSNVRGAKETMNKPLERNALAAVRRAPRAAARGNGVEQAYERIFAAIMDHSLPPGSRLVENRLCEIFGLGRTRVRQVLQRLANDQLVTLLPNRGGVVSIPTVQEARDIFEARRLIEAGTVAHFIERATRADLQKLREHVQQEKLAWRAKDRRACIRLSGEFHLLVAEGAGNATLLQLLRELISRSSLIVAVYQKPGAALCPPDEHQDLLAALTQRRAEAAQMMTDHLGHVLADLRLEDVESPGVDLYAVLGAAEA